MLIAVGINVVRNPQNFVMPSISARGFTGTWKNLGTMSHSNIGFKKGYPLVIQYPALNTGNKHAAVKTTIFKMRLKFWIFRLLDFIVSPPLALYTANYRSFIVNNR